MAAGVFGITAVEEGDSCIRVRIAPEAAAPVMFTVPTFASEAGVGAACGAGVGAPVATGVNAPHCPQNFACSGSGCLHWGQERSLIELIEPVASGPFGPGGE